MMIPLQKKNVITLDSKTTATMLIKRALTEPMKLLNPFKPEGITEITVLMTDFTNNSQLRRSGDGENVFYTIRYSAKPGSDYFISAERNLEAKIEQKTKSLLKTKSLEYYVDQDKLNDLKATMEIKTETIKVTTTPTTTVLKLADSSAQLLLLAVHLLNVLIF